MPNIPLFPLSLVAFPEERLNLHIFEPRYRQLVHECQEKNLTFGVTPVKDNNPISFGTEMEILEISHEYPDGKMDIKTKGKRKFKVDKFYSKAVDKLYPAGDVTFMEDDNTTEIIQVTKVVRLIEQLYGLMKMKIDTPEVSMDFRLYPIAHKIALNFDQEVALLKIHSEIERLEYVENHLKELIPVVTEMENLRKKIQMNGHFKNVIPPDLMTE